MLTAENHGEEMIKNREARLRGLTLVLVLGQLAILSMLGVTFVSMMRLEKMASTNYVDQVFAKVVSESGVE